MPLDRTVPALPVTSVTAAAQTYVDRLGFEIVHLDPSGYAIVVRDAAEVDALHAEFSGPARADYPVRTTSRCVARVIAT